MHLIWGCRAPCAVLWGSAVCSWHVSTRRLRLLSTFARVGREWTSCSTERDGEAALKQLHIASVDQDHAMIRADAHGPRLVERPPARSPVAKLVAIAPDVYRSIPTRAGRIHLLRLATNAAARHVLVHVPIGSDGSHLSRLVLDVPRIVLRACGVTAAAPGDRFGPEGCVHRFFDEEELLGEFLDAGLALHARRGFAFTLRPFERDDVLPQETPDPVAVEIARVLRVVRDVDAKRSHESPEKVLATMRARGRETNQTRGPIGRARLRSAIGWIDAFAWGGSNCYRRVLLESALDAGAADEAVVFGLDVGRTGHVAFEGHEERTFDVSFVIPP